MDFEKYTERSRGFMQSAQALALREGHQRFTPEHLLKVLLDDEEGLAAGLIKAAGGDPPCGLARDGSGLAKMPKVSGGGAGQVYLSPEMARVFDAAQKLAEQGWRQLRHGRTAVAGAGHGDERCRQGTEERQGSRRRGLIRPSTPFARAARRIRLRPSRAMTR